MAISAFIAKKQQEENEETSTGYLIQPSDMHTNPIISDVLSRNLGLLPSYISTTESLPDIMRLSAMDEGETNEENVNIDNSSVIGPPPEKLQLDLSAPIASIVSDSVYSTMQSEAGEDFMSDQCIEVGDDLYSEFEDKESCGYDPVVWAFLRRREKRLEKLKLVGLRVHARALLSSATARKMRVDYSRHVFPHHLAPSRFVPGQRVVSVADWSMASQYPALSHGLEHVPPKVLEVHREVKARRGILHPKRLPFRLAILMFTLFASLGMYISYDIPSAVADELMKDANMSYFEFNLLYSVYAWVNMITVIFGGVMVERMGIYWGGFLLSLAIILGQAIVWLGTMMGNYWIILCGRVVFSLPCDALLVLQSEAITSWFRGKELGFALGAGIANEAMGGVVIFFIIPLIHPLIGLNGSMLTGVLCLVASLVCGHLPFCLLDRYGQHQLKKEQEEENTALLGRANVREMDSMFDVSSIKSAEDEDTDETHPFIPLSNLWTRFTVTFWLVNLTGVLYYYVTYPYLALAAKFIMDQWETPLGTADLYMCIFYLFSGLFGPFVGLLMDMKGRVGVLCSGALILQVVVMLLFNFISSIHPLVYLCAIAFCYSVITTGLMSILPVLVSDDRFIGPAYTIHYITCNFGSAVGNMVLGLSVDKMGWNFFFVQCGLVLGTAVVVCVLCNASNFGAMNVKAADLEEIDEAEDIDVLSQGVEFYNDDEDEKSSLLG